MAISCHRFASLSVCPADRHYRFSGVEKPKGDGESGVMMLCEGPAPACANRIMSKRSPRRFRYSASA